MHEYNSDINIIGSIPDFSLLEVALTQFAKGKGCLDLKELLVTNNAFDFRTESTRKRFLAAVDSGPRQGFDAFIIIYKWSRDKLFTLKSVYIEKRETALRNRQSDLLGEKSAQAENEKDTIFHQLKEIESLRKKIDELLSEGYDPKLDDGVGKNIAPLQKRGIIAYEVLNPGQLKKYLNADW